MRIKMCLCLVIITLCLACQPDKSVQQKSAAHLQIDSALINYVKTTFHLSDQYWNIIFRHKQDTPVIYWASKEIIPYPGNFRFSAYHFGDGRDFMPFVIKISTLADSTISYFAFGDELYYSRNSNSGYLINNKLEFYSHTESDSSLNSVINLEKNLNQLIVKLNIQHKENAIYSLLDIMFDNLLRMKPVDYAEVDVYLSQLKRANKQGNANEIIKEFTMLREQIGHRKFCVRAKDGSQGYWIFDIIEAKGSYHVKPTFIGDLLYAQVYF